MSEVINGFTLNEVGEPANWSAIEHAFLSAVAALLPPAGTVLVTTEHRHARVYPGETGNPVITASAATIYLNAQQADVDTVIEGNAVTIATADAGLGVLHFPDNREIRLGAIATAPDCKIYSDGTRMHVNGVPDGAAHYASLVSGDLYYCSAAGSDPVVYRKT